MSTFSKDDLQAGQTLLNEKKVGPVLFSEGTYQVGVKEKGKELFWPFLQMTDEGELKDHFCSCQEAESKGLCRHLAAAWLVIFRSHETPLHVRFRGSLWNQLCQMAARRHSYETDCLKGSPQTGYRAFSTTKKELFTLKPRTQAGKQLVRHYIKDRKSETEETSLKFSNLAPDELKLWKEGRPSYWFSYELSFWSDLAKWWMTLQEEGQKYSIRYTYGKSPLPHEIVIAFADIDISFYISQANWPQLIPSLASVNSPLKSFELTHDQIRRLFYDPLRKVIHLDIVAENLVEQSDQMVQVGEWNFVPEQGFYPAKIDPLLKEKLIRTEFINEFLTRHQHLVERHLTGAKINPKPISASYALAFDETRALHVVCYVYEKGDLERIDAAFFGEWVYLSDKGFVKLTDQLFHEIHTVVPAPSVADFVTRHRHWLHNHPGFQTHIMTVESRLTYVMREQELIFENRLDLAEETEQVFDFGEWIYVKDRGFYSKTTRSGGHVVHPGLRVRGEEISKFIRANHDELENIPGFFTSPSPVQSSGLDISLNTDGKIVVRPHYTLSDKRAEIFENYTYIPQEGFCEIPSNLRLPEPYFKEVVIDEASEPYFVSYEIDTLKPFVMELNRELQKPRQLSLQINSLEREESGDWLVDLNYESDLGTIDVMTIWDAMNQGKRHLFSSAGLILLKSPRYNWLRGLSKKRWLKKGRQVRLTTLEWIRLFVFEDVQEPKEAESLKNWNEFKEFQTSIPIKLDGLESQLRNYQETGLKWLWFLYCHGLAGLLCDEMGLGKTHQAMALLAAAHNVKSDAKFLVVCPTSVIFHWEDILNRFFPKLRNLVYYGADRSLANFQEGYDLLLTSYGTLRSEKAALADLEFEVAIYDEIQIAKNNASQTHKALKMISAKTPIGLTGTPIENNLLELKALFDVVLPGYMPTETLYKELFVNPIEKQQDPEKKNLLARYIRPFVLRRKKSEVLQELPEKTETIAYCPLSDEQKRLYQEVYRASKEKLFKELEDTSKPVPFMHVFSLLTKLKQICNHPALYKNDLENYRNHSSGKWDLFVELLAEIRESGLKVVVFSQYLGMLDIIEAHLKEQTIDYAQIRGSTRNRKEEVLRFRDDPNCIVFLGSLQAAGVGIDLVSASVVIHYDRWWNPAKENQATDRVHRMGQSRGVQVFKLVTHGTLEEHIHHLIEKKLGLAEEVIGFDDQDNIKSLSREQLLDLLRLMDFDK